MQLGERLIVDFSRQPLQHWTWTPPAIPDFASPIDLAQLMANYRAKLAQIRQETGRSIESQGDLSDAALTQLLMLAYRASFLRDEGRSVRACLYVHPRQEDVEERIPSAVQQLFFATINRLYQRLKERRTNRFGLADPIVLDDHKQIARLAPALASDDAVLVIREHEGRLFCTGITLLDDEDAENNPFRMPSGWHGGGGLFINILDPGELRVSEGRREYTLRANEFRLYSAADSVQHVREWLVEVTTSLIGSCCNDPDWDTERIGDPQFAAVDLMILWSRAHYVRPFGCVTGEPLSSCLMSRVLRSS